MKYEPFVDGRWRLHIGLAALDVREWIEPDAEAAMQLALKRRLLAECPQAVFVALPESLEEQGELTELLLAHLREYFPERYQYREGSVVNTLTGERFLLSDFAAAPLQLAARLVQEDFCLLRPTPEHYMLSAGCVCFPSRWSLQEKLGGPLVAIHAPVPGYAAQLAGPVDRLFERLSAEKPLWRLNWTIVDAPELYLPPGPRPPAPPITVAEAGERLFVRVERQTLRRLPRTGAIVFTIRTYVHSVAAVAAQPERAAALATAIREIPESVQKYKSLVPVREALLAYLDGAVSGGGTVAHA